MRLLKEPLFHFFLIGAAIFIWFHIVAPENETAETTETITINENDIAQLSAGFKARWKREPSLAEMKTLVDASIREEVLVREARKLGLDRGDTVIRSRLSQKMDFLTEAIATSVTPKDEDLEAFLQQNAERYATPQKVAFNQVFLGEAPSEPDIEKALVTLRAGQDISDLPGSALLPASMPLTTPRAIDSIYGVGFSNGLITLEQGPWSGPVQSGYGVHLVQVIESEPSRVPPLADIYSSVLRDWRRATGEDLALAQYEALADGYEIVVYDFAGQGK